MEAASSFQIRLLCEMSKSLKDKNILISPVSIFLALTIAAQGAQGKTLEEMLHVLLKGKPLAELQKHALETLSALSESQSVKIANAVMTKVKPTEEFTASCKNFNAMIDKLVSAEQVNEWCKEKTEGKIQKLLDTIANIDMIILNAVYFNGKWLNPFTKDKTTNMPFKNSKGVQKEVPMMFKEFKDTMHFSDGKTQAVQLYYKQNDLSAFIILPESMPEFLATVNQNSINLLMGTTEEKTVNLSLPRFKIEGSTELNDVLSSLGMKTPFGDTADFSKMTKECPLKISEVVHKTFMSVDEQGTEAAAVTAVKMTRMCMPMERQPPVKMIVDRPFLFMINSSSISENCLFIALVNDV